MHRPDVPQRLSSRSCSTRPGWSGSSVATAACRLPRRRWWRRSATAFIADIERLRGELRGSRGADFAKGQRKDDVVARVPGRVHRAEGVLFIGRAQEKAAHLPDREAPQPGDRSSYPWIVTGTAMVNQYYFYCVDADFGPFFLKFCSYFPYNAKLCINGNEWAKRQAAKAGIGFTALDNGVRRGR